jgi:complement component 1 Q subcomponent-binding protein
MSGCSGLLPTRLSSVRQPSARSLSSSSSSAAETLSDILAREQAEDEGNELDVMPGELSELKKKLELEWKIVDDGPVTRLHRTLDGAVKVAVSFHCQDNVVAPDEYADEEDYGEEESSPVKFMVACAKAGKTLVFTCLSEAAEVHVQSVSVSSEDIDTILANSGIGANQYQGPEFTELAEDLQDAFGGYLEEEVGVDTDCAAFISMYSDFKEQTQYLQFLKDARSILS